LEFFIFRFKKKSNRHLGKRTLQLNAATFALFARHHNIDETKGDKWVGHAASKGETRNL
jgi:hypothetical protein